MSSIHSTSLGSADVSWDGVPDEIALPEVDTTLLIQKFKGNTLIRLCTLLSAFLAGKISYPQFLAELSDEDISFINKNAVAGFREFQEIGIEIPDALGKRSGIVLTNGDVKLNLRREDIQKKLAATISPATKDAAKATLEEGSVGYLEILRHLKENLTPQNVVTTSSKNAFEIRLEILKEAVNLAVKSNDVSEENILVIAEKLYRFVEGPRRR